VNFIQTIKDNIKFISLSFSLVVLIVLSAIYISNLLFQGKNSYEVYSQLKEQKSQLQIGIRELQLENANLQKQYLELKNLEPEEL